MVCRGCLSEKPRSSEGATEAVARKQEDEAVYPPVRPAAQLAVPEIRRRRVPAGATSIWSPGSSMRNRAANGPPSETSRVSPSRSR